MKKTVLLLVLAGTMCFTALHAQTLDKEIPVIAGKLSKTLVAKGRKKVAAIDFVDLQGRPTELGRFLAERLSVELVNAEGISVVDRANIKSILAEHKLSEEGLVKPENAKTLGEFAGVDAILIGTVTSLDDSIILTVKAVSTDTAEIVAAGMVEFRKTSEIQQLLVHGVTGDQPASSSRATSSDTDAIATKDLGDLRVELQSINKVTVTRKLHWEEKTALGIRCVFRFTNRNLKESLSFASTGERVGDEPGTRIRSQLTDSLGTVWMPLSLHGFSWVRAGGGASATAIADLIMSGRKGQINQNYENPAEKVWYGTLTVIPPGETVLASITFAQRMRDLNDVVSTIGDEVEYEGEFVVGTAGSKTSTFRVYVLMWDRITFRKANT